MSKDRTPALTLPSAKLMPLGFLINLDGGIVPMHIVAKGSTLVTLHPGDSASFLIRRCFFGRRWCVVNHVEAHDE